MEFNLFGIGTKYYGRKNLEGNHWTATLWIVFLYLPILPLGTARVTESMSFGKGLRIIPEDKMGFDFSQIFRTYLFGILFFLIIATAATGFIFLVRALS